VNEQEIKTRQEIEALKTIDLTQNEVALLIETLRDRISHERQSLSTSMRGSTREIIVRDIQDMESLLDKLEG